MDDHRYEAGALTAILRGYLTERRETLAYIAAIAAFPLLLLAINDSWVFPPPERWIDPYIYTGYFLDLIQHLNVFADQYYGTRLPWILLGATVHALGPYEFAQYLLRLILFYAAAFSLFAIVRMLFRNNVAATMTALGFGANTYFLRAIGWDYVDGFGIVLILVTMVCLAAAATKPRWRPWMAGAGAACVSMVVTYIMLVVIVPFQIGAYVFLNAWHRRNPTAAGIGYASLGAASALGLFGTINWALADRFLFFMPQLQMALTVSERRDQWKAADYAWVGTAIWLMAAAIGLTVALALLVFLLVRRRRGAFTDVDGHTMLLSAILVGLVGAFVAMELRGFWLLQISMYAGYLIPFAFLCLGAALARATAQVSRSRGLVLVAATAVSLLLPMLVESLHPSRACLYDCQVVGEIGALSLVCALLVAAGALLRRDWLTVAAFIVLGLVNILVTQHDVVEFPRSPVSRARALMIPDALGALRPFNRDGSLRFWYDFQEPLGGVYRAVAAANLWAYRLVSEDYPRRTSPLPGQPSELNFGDTIAVLTSAGDALPRVTRIVADLGMRPELLGSRKVARGDEEFGLTIIQLQPSDVQGVSDLDLSTVSYAPSAHVSLGRRKMVVRTSKAAWSYGAQLPVPGELRDEFGGCSTAFKIRTQVLRGTVGLGVLDAAGTSFLTRRSLGASRSASDVVLSVPKLGNAGHLVIQAWDTGTEGLIDVESVSAIRYACSADK